MFLSIITTVFNLENYIDKCIDSILCQNFNDYELILINDYSSDNSLSILNEYSKKDKRIRVINNNVNLGCGISRQIGIDNAKGEYIAFIDGDDMISGNYLQRMYESAISTNSDIIVSYSKKIIDSLNDNMLRYENYKNDINFYNIKSNVFKTPNEKISYLNSPSIPYLNNKIIRKSLFNKVTYSKRLYIEDMQTHHKLVFHSNKVVTLSDDGLSYYLYRRHNNSLTISADKGKNFLFFTLFHMDVYEYFNFEINNSEFSKYYNKHYILLHVNRFLRNKTISHTELKERFPEYYEEFLTKWDKIKKRLN